MVESHPASKSFPETKEELGTGMKEIRRLFQYTGNLVLSM